MTTTPRHHVEPQPTTVPQKRRRRAPATGAQEDCHSCRKRQVPCDRRRPYCSQCVDLGKECSGYKTTLTWGVGVASRGKLRGMTLPVANASPTSPINGPKTATEVASQEEPRPRKRTKSTSSVIPRENPYQPHPFQHAGSQNTLDFSTDSSWSTSPTDGQSTPLAVSMPTSSAQIQQHSAPSVMSLIGMPREEAAVSSSADSVHSAMSVGSYGDHHFEHFPRHSSPPHDMSYFGMQPQHQVHLQMSQSQEPTSPIVFTPIEQPPSSHYWPINAPLSQPTPSSSYDNTSVFPFSPPTSGWFSLSPAQSHQSNPYAWHEDQLPVVAEEPIKEEQTDEDFSSALDDPHSDASLIITRELAMTHISPRLRSLLEYYDKAICPVLVAFDGPTNPYRMHVLPLALHNDGLQNALAALATNNLRMRRLQDIPSFQNSPDNSAREIAAAIGRPTPEEQRYKAMSIELLNSQLANPHLANDDGVLATLLILCLFHVCDSGFSKFKTQLAGVQKLLRLRGRRWRSEIVGWVEMFFAWFDVMTSAVNDRETEIKGDSLDLLNFSSDLGALEHFSGCDGRLFKIIARLGRLNVLSQGRPVRDLSEVKIARPIQSDYYSLGPHNTKSADDDRSQFWREWNEIHERLQSWQMDIHSPGLASPGSPGQSDMMHISESFRYSALIYIERLARPDAEQWDTTIQNYVDQSMYHIQAIGPTSCVLKFMLWPIFITGTECKKEDYRIMIRRTCADIQRESGFYNNLSGLELLERVWRDMDEGNDRIIADSQAFRWRQAMRRVDGEYIVI